MGVTESDPEFPALVDPGGLTCLFGVEDVAGVLDMVLGQFERVPGLLDDVAWHADGAARFAAWRADQVRRLPAELGRLLEAISLRMILARAEERRHATLRGPRCAYIAEGDSAEEWVRASVLADLRAWEAVRDGIAEDDEREIRASMSADVYGWASAGEAAHARTGGEIPLSDPAAGPDRRADRKGRRAYFAPPMKPGLDRAVES